MVVIMIFMGPKNISEQEPRFKPLASNIGSCTQPETRSLAYSPNISVTAFPSIFTTKKGNNV